MKLQGNFKGNEGKETFAFNTQVLMEGTNVLEGLKNMVKFGIIQTPIPDWMSEISAMSANVVTLSSSDN